MVDSPCNGTCEIDPQNGLCLGCRRTQLEITSWLNYTNKKKKVVLKVIKTRNNIHKKDFIC